MKELDDRASVGKLCGFSLDSRENCGGEPERRLSRNTCMHIPPGAPGEDFEYEGNVL